MLQSILNGIKYLFSTPEKERELQDTKLLEFNRNATYEQRKEYLQKHLKDIYDWIIQAEPYVDQVKTNRVAILAIRALGEKQVLLYLENQAINLAANKNSLDVYALEIEKKKLAELQEMSWRQSQQKRI